ncbi:uberolysin/carnocyclin family circular bacteriocin [Cutibacterium sp. V947]|uniref:uberolysin/carnocyclin family circular bacteriocin n=1 Tax=unclassified Cutibacterium TaxID=2649671 RepID=UPI003EE22DA4
MQNTLTQSKSSRSTVGVAALVAVIGVVLSTFTGAYIAGMFGLSTSAASQIVNAVSVGGAALSIAMAVASGGIAGAAVATAKWAIKKWGKKVAIA